MQPEQPSLLHRIRWGNVAWALAAVAAVGLVVAWPHLQRRGPGLPDETASVPRDPAPQPAQPTPATRPALRPAPRPPVHAHPSARRRVAKPRPRPTSRRRPRARPSTAPAPVPDLGGGGGSSPGPPDRAPAAPAGDEEFLPG